ncbi:peptide/nickel transport system substrate-binding protein/oligopeptide transport system substrate-binding protein [Nesterenkonia sandarakina]|uniref:Peptide/nickel transport system substrate-binding protein/oligopeptide transport system substrate-binding protein n=1 Tax=Nesterenkonia sandarakina TaxID=272918 RepID=A0A2T0YGK3_9MICC|nr:peptide/nickel transport system substrate-binding protein/oligopeptide transport system substrate-binding protein [Nesterenkonia sandarakina]
MHVNKTSRRSRATGAVAVSAAAALVLAACGGGDDNGGDTGNGEAAAGVEGGGTVSAYNCEPQFLVPANSTEVCGSWVLGSLFTGLTQTDFDTYEPTAGVAESWDTEDNVTWTFTLGEDWTFHDGEAITAQTFVDTYNWAVDPDNAQQSANFFDNFLGYQEVVDGDAEEMEGVRAVDDYTLEIELTEPFSPLPDMLTYTAFYPMPSVAYDDIEAFEQAPVGNGRYMMDGEWEHDQQIAVNRFEDWAGENPGLPERIEWRIYSEVDTAYLDVQAGNLDILDAAPPNRRTTVEADFGDNAQDFDTSAFTYLGFPLYQEEFQDADVRHALSMAIDRELIIDNIFDGAQTPAENIIPPDLIEGNENTCEFCQYDPEAAADLYEEAGGPEELTVYFNSGAGHEDWVEAVANQWRDNLGIEDITFESLEFAQYLGLHDEEAITGPYRLGWTLSYPSAQYAMEPIYSTGASSNYADYSSEEFDALISQANAETDPDAAAGLYTDAEAILLEDMPVIPMWFTNYQVVHSDRIDGESLFMDQATFTRLEQVVVTQE